MQRSLAFKNVGKVLGTVDPAIRRAHRPGSGGAGWFSGHAGGYTLQGLTAWVFRHRGFPGRGQGSPETGVDMT